MVSSTSTQSSPKLRVDREECEGMEIRQPLDDKVSLALMQIPAGDFMMGSPDHELERLGSEGPQHRVYVQEFWMGQGPVTQEEWRIVANTYPKVNRDLEPDPSHFKDDWRPVENVSWDDAVEFCQRLSQHTGFTYRLPTEAEWEYACRAGTTTPFHFGETITTDYANYRGTDDEYGSGSYGGGPKGDYREETTPVGSFKVTNRFGLADMHGNVWEWCLDHWHENYEGAPLDGSAWLENTPQSINARVVRGGSWFAHPGYCRPACRAHYTPVNRFDFLGFRVVLAPQ